MLYEAQDVISIKPNKEGKPSIREHDVNSHEYQDIMDAIVPPEIHLKIGSQVMLTKNLSIEEGLVNGSRGVVEELHDERVVVKFRSGAHVSLIAYSYEYEDENVICARAQFPLILAWSITIHKAVGATLDYAIADCGTSIFAPGMGYVVLSRCRTLEGLLLVNFLPEVVRPHPKALTFEETIIKDSVLAKPIHIRPEPEPGDPKGKSDEDDETTLPSSKH